jgi:hypothetical protein
LEKKHAGGKIDEASTGFTNKPVALDFDEEEVSVIPDFRTEFEAFLSDAATTDSLFRPNKEG